MTAVSSHHICAVQGESVDRGGMSFVCLDNVFVFYGYYYPCVGAGGLTLHG